MLFCLQGAAEKELFFPGISELKSKLQSGNDREGISFVENLLEQKDFQDATKVSTDLITASIRDQEE